MTGKSGISDQTLAILMKILQDLFLLHDNFNPLPLKTFYSETTGYIGSTIRLIPGRCSGILES